MQLTSFSGNVTASFLGNKVELKRTVKVSRTVRCFFPPSSSLGIQCSCSTTPMIFCSSFLFWMFEVCLVMKRCSSVQRHTTARKTQKSHIISVSFTVHPSINLIVGPSVPAVAPLYWQWLCSAHHSPTMLAFAVLTHTNKVPWDDEVVHRGCHWSGN